MENADFPRPRWSTKRLVTRQELARIERVRKALQAEYGNWTRIAKDCDLHYNSVLKYALGRTQRPSEEVVDKVERALTNRRWEKRLV